MSIVFTLGISFSEIIVKDNIFGTTNLVIGLVLLTVFINTGFGIRKSLIKSSKFFAKAQKFEYRKPEHRFYMRKFQNHKFSIKRVYFVFFKCLSLLGYLFFVKALLDDGGTFFDFTIEILCKAPIALFWYYEFKSIGENSEYIYERKASIFKIVEFIFEPRISKFLGTKTPSDGIHNDLGFKEDQDDYTD